MGNQMNMKNNHKTARDITGDHVTPQNRDTPRAQYREDSRNYRKHSKKNLDLIGRSLAENGAGRSILLDNTGESIAGSGTLNRAQKLGVPIREIHTDGSELIAVIRDDIGPDDPRRKRLALADNACSDSSGWDFDAIEADGWEPEELADWGIEAMKVWNVYRSRLIGQIMQDAGIRVIPTVSWAEPETYAFCFDGLPQGGNVAVSTVGVMCDKEAQRIFRDGMAAMIEKVKPALILMYGKPMPEACGDVPYRSYENDTFGAQFAARVKARKEE